MKKFLISVLLLLLVILTYSITMKNVAVFGWKSNSVKDIKALDEDLNSKIATAKQLSEQEYINNLAKIDTSIKNLKIAKEKYEEIKTASENVDLEVAHTKKYKIERLWIALEIYAKNKNLELKIDVKDTTIADTYDLEFTLVGTYIDITDFIYNIEKDDTLDFKIQNFALLPNTTVTTDADDTEKKQTQTANVDTSKLKATFEVEGIEIDFE